MNEWFSTSWQAVAMVAASTLWIFIAVIVLTRVCGLRSFSKMSGFDFAMTVAVGSVIASTVLTPSPPMLQATAALICIFGLQLLTAKARTRSEAVSKMVDNEPLLLMRGKIMLERNMHLSSVTRNDLIAKLREANVINLSQVRAVVLETTGDISVLHCADDSGEMDALLLEDVSAG